MTAFIRLAGAPTQDIRQDGLLYRYCTTCDAHYLAGWFAKHKDTSTHTRAMADKKKMDVWYQANGQ